MRKAIFRALILAAVITLLLLPSNNAVSLDVTENDFNLKLLGKHLFFDKISVPDRMSCSTCHDPAAGWTHKNPVLNMTVVVALGAIPFRTGTVKSPMNAYASEIQPFGPCTNGAFSPAAGVFPENGRPYMVCGGNFWNARAEGNETALFPDGATKHLGEEVFAGIDNPPDYAEYIGPTSDQALNPMPNPVEQNIKRKAVCQHVQSQTYAALFEKAWGVDIDCSGDPNIENADQPFDISFKRMMLAIGAYQKSDEVNSFSSKRDKALRNDSDGQFPLSGLTAKENLGHDLFYSTFLNPTQNPNARTSGGQPIITNCAICHSDNPGINPAILGLPFPAPAAPPDTGVEPFQLYTDQCFHNIGVPRNPQIPNPGPDPVSGISLSDIGLYGHTKNIAHLALQKTPCLRNVDKRPFSLFPKAYGHNGWFKSLKSIVHFYNTAAMEEDLPPGTVKLHSVTRCPAGIETEKDALANNCWPAPASTNGSVVGVAIGNMGMSPAQEDALVAYMKTLTDTYTPKPPAPYTE